jgi:transcriptional regulator with XRE-family HTH domain
LNKKQDQEYYIEKLEKENLELKERIRYYETKFCKRGDCMKPNPVETVKRIKSIRSNFGMTMEQFADLIEMSKGNINNWERGFSLPNKRKINKIAELSNKTIDWIKWGTLEEYITSYLIGIGYELYIKDFPEILTKVFKDIQEKYSDTFSLDKDYELLDSIIKNIFTKYYSNG